MFGAPSARPSWSLEAPTFPPGSLASPWTLLWFLGLFLGGFLFWAAPFLAFRRPSPLPFAFPPLGVLLFAGPRSRFGSLFLWLSLVFLGTFPHFGVALWLGSSLGPPLPYPSPCFLGCFLGYLPVIYILHYMIYHECPIGFTAYRFLTLAAAEGKCPHFVGDMRHEQFANKLPFCCPRSTYNPFRK